MKFEIRTENKPTKHYINKREPKIRTLCVCKWGCCLREFSSNTNVCVCVWFDDGCSTMVFHQVSSLNWRLRHFIAIILLGHLLKTKSSSTQINSTQRNSTQLKLTNTHKYKFWVPKSKIKQQFSCTSAYMSEISFLNSIYRVQ